MNYPLLPEPDVPEGDWFVRDAYIKEYAKKAIDADRAQRISEGYVLVPKEPTPEMCEVTTWDFNRFYSAKEIYAAMIAAAPKPPPAEPSSEPPLKSERG